MVEWLNGRMETVWAGGSGRGELLLCGVLLILKGVFLGAAIRPIAP